MVNPSAPMAYRIRFRLMHLLLILAVISVAMWIWTQAGMATAEVEVIEASGLLYPGPDGSFDNFGAGLATICIRFNQPDDGLKRVRLFLNSTGHLNEEDLLFQPVTFRYRKERVLWIAPDNYIEMGIRQFGIEDQDIEESIVEVFADD